MAALNQEVSSKVNHDSASNLANIWKMDQVLSLSLLESAFGFIEKQKEEAKKEAVPTFMFFASKKDSGYDEAVKAVEKLQKMVIYMNLNFLQKQ